MVPENALKKKSKGQIDELLTFVTICHASRLSRTFVPPSNELIC